MRRRLGKKVIAMVCILGMMLANVMPVEAKASNSKILKNYVKYLQSENYGGPLKYFALVDANKDGKPELLATSKMKKGKIKSDYVDFVSFYKNSGKACSAGGYGTAAVLYYNTKQKGILFNKDMYEYLDGVKKGSSGKVFTSNAKTISKKGKKYVITEGHFSGEYGLKTKKVSASVVKKYRKKWAFTKKSKNTKKVKFYKVTKANLNKLKKGKIKVQK